MYKKMAFKSRHNKYTSLGKLFPITSLIDSNDTYERRFDEITMETKSRYEVIADLESKKRDLIREKSQLDDVLKNKEKSLKMAEREKSDEIMEADRQIEDIKEDITNFKKTMNDRKETIEELIKSMDDSLKRFGELSKNEKSNSQKK